MITTTTTETEVRTLDGLTVAEMREYDYLRETGQSHEQALANVRAVRGEIDSALLSLLSV